MCVFVKWKGVKHSMTLSRSACMSLFREEHFEFVTQIEAKGFFFKFCLADVRNKVELTWKNGEKQKLKFGVDKHCLHQNKDRQEAEHQQDWKDQNQCWHGDVHTWNVFKSKPAQHQAEAGTSRCDKKIIGSMKNNKCMTLEILFEQTGNRMRANHTTQMSVCRGITWICTALKATGLLSCL